MKILLTTFFVCALLLSSLQGATFTPSFIRNGDFQEPPISGSSISYQNSADWMSMTDIQNVTITKANLLNSNYKVGDQALLITKNTKIIQNFSLPLNKTFSLSLTYSLAASSSNLSSGFKIYFNENIVYDIVPIDNKIRTLSTMISSQSDVSTYSFMIIGYGDNNCGIIIDSINLNSMPQTYYPPQLSQVYSVLSGIGHVTSVQVYGGTYIHNNYFLDYYFPDQISGLCTHNPIVNHWVQISLQHKRKWIGIITQGRKDDLVQSQWVQSYSVKYTNDGINWFDVEEGRIFTANTNTYQKVRNNFKTQIQAKTIRIVVKSFHNRICLRFDAIFLDEV